MSTPVQAVMVVDFTRIGDKEGYPLVVPPPADGQPITLGRAIEAAVGHVRDLLGHDAVSSSWSAHSDGAVLTVYSPHNIPVAYGAIRCAQMLAPQ